MGLIDNKEAQPVRDRKQAPTDEFVVSQSLRRNQEHVELVSLQPAFDPGPVRFIRRVDRFCSQAYIPSSSDLVPHQRQERRNEKRAARPLVSKKSRGKKVDETLAPSGSLNDQEPCASLHDCGDGLELPIAELRVGVSKGLR